MCVRVAFLSLNFTSSLDRQGSHFHGESCVGRLRLVHSFLLSSQFFLCRSHIFLPSMVPCPPWCLALRGALPSVVPCPPWCLALRGALPSVVPCPPWCLALRDALREGVSDMVLSRVAWPSLKNLRHFIIEERVLPFQRGS